MGSYWESNPMPLTLAVDVLTTELRLTLQQPSTLPQYFSLGQVNDEEI